MLQRLILRVVIGEKVATLGICCLLKSLLLFAQINFVCWFQGPRVASARQGAGAASALQGAAG